MPQGHSQAGRTWSSLIVVENTTHRHAILEHHGTRGVGFRRNVFDGLATAVKQ